MKELLDHDTYIFKTDTLEYESIIIDEDGNVLGKAVEDFKYVGGEASLFDSKENKWGTVKENAGFLGFGLTYVFHDHNEFLLAKT